MRALSTVPYIRFSRTTISRTLPAPQRDQYPFHGLYNLYQFLLYTPRYDGVFRTRPGTSGIAHELALFEVSGKFDGEDSAKWKKDRLKLIAGGRAMLYRLMELVEHDPAVVKKLRVVGVPQAGITHPPPGSSLLIGVGRSSLATLRHATPEPERFALPGRQCLGAPCNARQAVEFNECGCCCVEGEENRCRDLVRTRLERGVKVTVSAATTVMAPDFL